MVSVASWPQHRQREAFPPGLGATAASQAAPQGPDVRCAFTWPCPGARHHLGRASRVCVLEEAGVFLPLPQTFPVNWNSFVLPKLTRPGFTCGRFAFELDLIFEEIVFFTQKFLGKIGKHRKAKKKEKIPHNSCQHAVVYPSRVIPVYIEESVRSGNIARQTQHRQEHLQPVREQKNVFFVQTLQMPCIYL